MPSKKRLHLIEDKPKEKHDVWLSEIRIKLRGKERAQLMKLIAKLRKKWREAA